MARRDRRRNRALARARSCAKLADQVPKRPRAYPRVQRADRKALLLGTALASTFLIASIAAPAPVQAQQNCNAFNVAGDPIVIGPGGVGAINCVTDLPRTGDVTSDFAAINLETDANAETIFLNNSGKLDALNAGGRAYGVRTLTAGDDSGITIINSGDIDEVVGSDDSFGIYALTGDFQVVYDRSTINITNRGDMVVRSVAENASGVYAYSNGEGSTVTVTNDGFLRVTADRAAEGIDARSDGDDSNVTVVNHGDMVIRGQSRTRGISALTDGVGSIVRVTNTGNLTVFASPGGPQPDAFGIDGYAGDDDSSVTVTNRGTLTVRATDDAYGIRGRGNNPVTITNFAKIDARSTGAANGNQATGISADTNDDGANISITNHGELIVAAQGDATGIETDSGVFSDTTIVNFGPMTVTSRQRNAFGIDAYLRFAPGTATIENHGLLTVTSDQRKAYGIRAYARYRPDSSIKINNTGELRVDAERQAYGIFAFTRLENSPIEITNSGELWSTSTGNFTAHGILGRSLERNSSVHIVNSGDVTARATTQEAYGIAARTGGDNSRVEIVNNGPVNASSDFFSFGIGATTGGINSPITVTNNGDVSATGPDSHGISVSNYGQNSLITINNAGSVRGGTTGVRAGAYDAPNPTKIFNTGDISASSHRAIDVNGYGRSYVYNSGLLTGFVDLTDQSDRFVNQAGGVFDAKGEMPSDFGDGDDLFFNQSGGRVQAGTINSLSEAIAFRRLEVFRNRGTISLQDGGTGDTFTISNTEGDTDLDFVAGAGSTLAVDAFLGGPGSPTDTFKIEGNVSGTTTVVVNNTNFGPGVFNPTGTDMVVEVTGATPSASNFQLAQPIDTGFFDYDLFFTPTNSGFWELRSFPGGGAHLLPQLLTAAQDIWHQGSSTWFDRTADLRVLMAGGAAPTAYDPGGKVMDAGVGQPQLTPAVWARGSGGWLDRDDSARTRAFGRNYTFDLDRELTTIDFQVGVDMGSYDVLGQGDALVFGVLGGFVHGALDYEGLARSFDFDGGQVGAYATYLNGGLFVDTLLNAHIYSLETGANLGFPDSLDANTFGLRTDAGYRFGSFTGGAFLEPLGTIEVMWADIDGFSLGGNTVSFNDEANVRGRLGLRAGTTMQVWEGTLMEPFVIGSLWSNLSDNNSATLVSTGTTFRFNDDLEDVWGEISAGVNFFNFSQTTAVFAKVDVTVGDDVSGVGGKAGMRVNW